MPHASANHYATLGLHRRCTSDQIRTAYRLLAKQHHPDLNPQSAAALALTQEINAAYEILSHPDNRAAYDRELKELEPSARPPIRSSKAERNLAQEVQLRLEEFLRGVTLEVRVNDPGNPDGPETYPLVIPPETAPGTRFRVARAAPFEGGFVLIKARARADFRFKVRGSDLRCDLKIKPERAAQGGTEMLRGVSGTMLRVQIPRGIKSGECILLPGEGLPKARGGRGDLLVRITYRPGIRIVRAPR
jgi:curved DNA-binding protein